MSDYVVTWTRPAALHLKRICDYLDDTAPNQTERVRFRILHDAIRLTRFPYMGRVYRDAIISDKHYRTMLSSHYQIIYEIADEKTIFIIAVFDSRQAPKKLHHLLP